MKKINVFITAIMMIASYGLTAQVAITTDGSSADGSAMLDVQSTTKGFLPPRMTETDRDLISPVEGLIIYNTTTHQPNYYNGTVWMNYDGTAAATLEVGDYYQGGIIAYILWGSDPGYVEGETHGLIAAPSDQSTAAEWGCDETEINGADGAALGTGNQNTIDIEAGCDTEGTAADICANLTLGGYSDWFLPSKDELNKLYENQETIGGFASDWYWSSTEADDEGYFYAWRRNFSTGSRNMSFKYETLYVRAVRAF